MRIEYNKYKSILFVSLYGNLCISILQQSVSFSIEELIYYIIVHLAFVFTEIQYNYTIIWQTGLLIFS